MRLLHTTKITLSSFEGDSIPPYAILSHTWGNEEVLFQDLLRKDASQLDGLAGYSKIRSCCALAASEGHEYVWIDTCCIDKTSSAELSEAINSMYRWYQDAEVCYAYLADVRMIDRGPWCADGGRDFRDSRWFTRGWTLQELLAPKDVVFYGSDWQEFGSMSSLIDQISLITGIRQGHLIDISGASAAQKMSWASRRKTTRVEDIAYSLMGIFDVNMPLLYGEGKKAFTRLQHEIVKISHDESIFAWADSGLVESGMFAQSPEAFVGSGDVVEISEGWEGHDCYIHRAPYAVTNRGLAIETDNKKQYKTSFSLNEVTTFLPLNCRRQPNSGAFFSGQGLVVELEQISRYDFVRSSPGQLSQHFRQVDVDIPSTLVYVQPSCVHYNPQEPQKSLLIDASSLLKRGFLLYKYYGGHPAPGLKILSKVPKTGYWEITLRRRQSFVALLLRSSHCDCRQNFILFLKNYAGELLVDDIVLTTHEKFRMDVDKYKNGMDKRYAPSLTSVKLHDNHWVSVNLKEEEKAGKRQHILELRTM